MKVPRRLLLLLVPTGVFVVSLWWLTRAPGVPTHDEVIYGRVIDVGPRARGPDKPLRAPVRVTIELPDGGRGSLWWPPPGPALGARVAVRVRQYDDGSRRVSRPSAIP